MAVVAAPPPGQHVTNNESRWNFPHTDSCDLPLQNPRSNLGFQRSHCEGLDDSLGRLCFHDRFFAKHHLLSSFGCWLLSCLDHAKAREGELAHLFTSAVPTSANDIRSLVTTAFFSSQPVASASARAPLLMAFAAAFIAFGAMAIFWGRFCKARTKLRA